MDTVDDTKYVVLDVETNGLSSQNDDLLSISLFKPDTDTFYDRFLPLELNSDVYTTWINGITKRDLKNKEPLSQAEVDVLIKDFELDRRIILTYGRIDRTFLQNYFKRHQLDGFYLFRFLNFKKLIISPPSFSSGAVTKDALCTALGINGVSAIHSGKNDCFLEWQLFKKMNGRKLFVDGGYHVYYLNDDYIVPASYLSYYPNFKYHSDSYIKAKATFKDLKTFYLKSRKLKKFGTNIDGVVLENLLSSLLNAKPYNEVEQASFLTKNKKKLKYVGDIPSPYNKIFVIKNADGLLSAVRKTDKRIVNQINEVLEDYRRNMADLVSYIKKDLFRNEDIRYQELIVDQNSKTLAICDFSSKDIILEMKAYSRLEDESLANQLHCQSDGRRIYVLSINWLQKSIQLTLSELTGFEKSNKKLVPLIFQAKHDITKRSHKKKSPKIRLSKDELLQRRISRFQERVSQKSNNTIVITDYTGSRSKTGARCLRCGSEWQARSDKIIDRGCPNCKKRFFRE